MTFVQTLLSPLRPAVATLLSPASTCSVYSLGCAVLIAFAWLAWRRMRRDRPVALRTLARAIFSRRVLLHRSTFADLAYCVIGLATFGAILGWAVVSTSWISDGVAALLTRGFGPAPHRRAPDFALDAARTIRALSRLRTRLLLRPHAQAPHSGAVGIAQGAPLGRSADAAGQLPRSPARFAHPRQQSRAVHRRDRRRGSIRAWAEGGVIHPVRSERADAALHLSHRAAPAQRDLDSVHRRYGGACS